jgi:hypothetical protein
MIKYAEGDWFAVPLRNGGFASGVISRAMPRKEGILIGYFFGPRRATVPSLETMADLAPPQALFVRRFGHLGLLHGTWPLLGRLDSWDRGEWHARVFGRYEELTGRSFKITYDDSDPNMIVHRESVDRTDLANLPRDGLLGAGAVERTLSELLI